MAKRAAANHADRVHHMINPPSTWIVYLKVWRIGFSQETLAAHMLIQPFIGDRRKVGPWGIAVVRTKTLGFP
jgi:hypothetical protein